MCSESIQSRYKTLGRIMAWTRNGLRKWRSGWKRMSWKKQLNLVVLSWFTKSFVRLNEFFCMLSYPDGIPKLTQILWSFPSSGWHRGSLLAICRFHSNAERRSVSQDFRSRKLKKCLVYWISSHSLVFQKFQEQNYRLQYFRIPICPDQSPSDNYLDEYVRIIKTLDPTDPLIFNCGMGVVRSK